MVFIFGTQTCVKKYVPGRGNCARYASPSVKRLIQACHPWEPQNPRKPSQYLKKYPSYPSRYLFEGEGDWLQYGWPGKCGENSERKGTRFETVGTVAKNLLQIIYYNDLLYHPSCHSSSVGSNVSKPRLHSRSRVVQRFFSTFTPRTSPKLKTAEPCSHLRE